MRILIVDDEPNIRRTMNLHLTHAGHEVTAVATAEEALSTAATAAFDAAFVDVRLGTASGLDLLVELHDLRPNLPVIVITAYASLETAIEALRRGAADYLAKPFVPAQLDLALERVTRLARLETRLRALESEQVPSTKADELASRNPRVQALLALARKAAESDAKVLLRGESGTGKSRLARAIHRWSARAEHAFVTVSCPAVPAELLEAELFGHVRGAFTGAARDNPGRIALAEGGTLLLDEIGDLPLALQPKLLRFLQEGEYERVGEGTLRRADVRILAATNRDLERDVKAGRFREDLFYRLAVVTFEMPPLRERREDILPLAEMLLRQLAPARPGLHLSPEATRALEARDWPGNIRELRNVLERATIFATSAEIGAELVSDPTAAPSTPQVGALLPLADIERAHVEAVVARSKSLKEAAAILGVDPATLWRWRSKG